MTENPDDSAFRAYDFQRPSRLSREQIRRIDYLHASLAKRVSVSLAGVVRDYVEVEVKEVTEIPWSQFLKSIPTPCAAFSFASQPLEGVGVLNMDPQLAFGLVDRLFGGKGEPFSAERELTPIEQKVVGNVAIAILKEIEFAWIPIARISISAAGFAPSPDFIQTTGINESVVTVRLEVRTSNLHGNMLIGYPYLMFEPVLRALIKPAPSERKREPDKKKIADILSRVELPVAARLASSLISMGVLMNLEEGDVLMLDNGVSDEVEVFVGDKQSLMGRPGDLGGKLAIRITRSVEEGGI
jgi:flagellar motor switch protein FliM